MTWLCPVRARGVHNNGLWWLRRTAERYRRHLSLPRQWSPSNAVQQRPLHHRPAVRTHHIRRIWIDCQGLQQLLCTCTNCSIINLLTITNYYCLSNAMHGENINLHLCVCVSVYVSVTLSVNSPTGQTPQRIFTVDSLTDADLHKDVPFGGINDDYSHKNTRFCFVFHFLKYTGWKFCLNSLIVPGVMHENRKWLLFVGYSLTHKIAPKAAFCQ